MQIKQLVFNTNLLPHTQKRRIKTFFTNLKRCDMWVWQSLQDVFQISIALLIGLRMSEIMATYVHSG